MKAYAITYRGSVPNQHKSLSRTWQLAELRTRLSDDLLTSFNELEDTINVNLWDVGIGGSRILENGDYISIVCRDTIYTARIMVMIDDPKGLIGDTVDWSRLGGRPWASPFFLEKTEVTKRNYDDTTDFLDRSSEGNSGGLYVFSSEQKMNELFDYVGYKMNNKKQKEVKSDANKAESSPPNQQGKVKNKITELKIHLEELSDVTDDIGIKQKISKLAKLLNIIDDIPGVEGMVILKELQIQLGKHAYSLKYYKTSTTLLDPVVKPPILIRTKDINPLINEFKDLHPDISIQEVFLLFGMDDYGMLPEILKD